VNDIVTLEILYEVFGHEFAELVLSQHWHDFDKFGNRFWLRDVLEALRAIDETEATWREGSDW
jgi:hypothetical protein